MPIKILMPALSPTMKEGNLTKWLKKEGDKIKAGTIIAEIETDKATMEMEAVDEGILAKIIIPEGTEGVSVHSLIALILEDGEEVSSLDAVIAQNLDAPKNHKLHEDITQPLSPSSTSQDTAHDQRIFASPLAKRIAADKNIDLKTISGSGPHGRVVKADLLENNVCNNTPLSRNTQEFTIKKHTNIGKIIAERLLESKQTIPHFYLTIECRLDKLLDLRTEMNHIAGTPPGYKLSVNDFIVKASALALQSVSEVNASWDDQHIIMYNNVDISIAVAAPSGLITPVLKNADRHSLPEISNRVKDLVARARDNKLKPEEFQGGGFTISNLGMYGIKTFSAIINPPQSCILAVGEGVKRAIVDQDQIKIATMMNVTLSCDHRIVDGVIGARFLSKFKEYIEHPLRMICHD